VTALGGAHIDPGTPVAALAGVARPSRFFRELRDTGLEIRAELAYRDHHPYSPADVKRIGEAVTRAGAQWVVTTEKDLVRLQALGDLPFRVAWRRLDVVPEDPDVFCRWLASRLQAARDMKPRTGAGATAV
jgi:tetraacyldisaccharide-1-P 4'-kinase